MKRLNKFVVIVVVLSGMITLMVGCGDSDTKKGDNTSKKNSQANLQVGQYVTLGKYEQDNDLSNGAEPIEWVVQDIDGDKALLVSRYVLDCLPYHYVDDEDDDYDKNKPYEPELITWEDCTLRSWLNNNFYDSAFSDEDKKCILTVSLANEDNQYSGAKGGNTTKDKVFCLSVSEILKYNVFNSWDKENYTGYSETLLKTPTAYAQRGRLTSFKIPEEYYNEYLLDNGYSKSIIGTETSCWWLRSPGGYDENNGDLRACLVDVDGKAGPYEDDDMDDNDIGVCPAIWVSTAELHITTVPIEGAPTVTPTVEPTEEPAWTPTTGITFETTREMLEVDRDYLEKVENLYIGPFLKEYRIEKRAARALGKNHDNTKYEMTYVCKKDGCRLTLVFTVTVNTTYSVDSDMEDIIYYDNILFEGLYEGEWTVISEWMKVHGLAGHGVN